ncbi:MAG TPA: glycosyltransferase family 2 protein [Bacteroidia bacterium]
MPKLSVITINYNDAKGLKETILSVVEQTRKDFEFVVIDGGSTDGSVDVINEYKDLISIWTSEKDKGIYDAQNKGIQKASGEYVLFLNSGDTFYSNQVVDKFYNFLQENDSAMIYGNTNLVNGNKNELLVQPGKLPMEFWYMGTLNHQAVFMKRDLFERFGLYDLKYRICADFDLFLRAYVKDPGMFAHINETICNYDQTGFSASKENFNKMLAEREQILLANLSPEVYTKIKKAYNASLPLKRQVINYMIERPLLNSAFKRVYKLYAGLKGNDE